MTQKPRGHNEIDTSSQDDEEISPKALLKLLSIASGPLEYVEEVKFPEPLSPLSPTAHLKQTSNKRGPKSKEDWMKKVRRDWGNMNNEEKLAESWLAQLPAVQKLAASKYGGRTIGSGLALQELLKKALAESQQYEMENQTREILNNFPKMSILEIASKLGIDRSYLSRRYVTRATSLLTKSFQRVIDRSN